MSEELEKFVRSQMQITPNSKLPDSEKLAKSYETLFWANGGRPVDVDQAETMIADRTNLNKETIRHQIMTRLRKRGYVTLNTGMAAVEYIPNVDLVDMDDSRQRTVPAIRAETQIRAEAD